MIMAFREERLRTTKAEIRQLQFTLSPTLIWVDELVMQKETEIRVVKCYLTRMHVERRTLNFFNNMN